MYQACPSCPSHFLFWASVLFNRNKQKKVVIRNRGVAWRTAIAMAGPDLSAAPVLLEESDLESIKYNVLVHLRRQLVENVDPRRFLTFLRSKYVIDERESDEIRSMRSRSASAEVFLDILATKGQEGYDEFCQAILHDQTQTFLLTSMNKTLEILKARVLEHKQKRTYAYSLTLPIANSIVSFCGEESSHLKLNLGNNTQQFAQR